METPCRAIGTKVRGVRSFTKESVGRKVKGRFLDAEIFEDCPRISIRRFWPLALAFVIKPRDSRPTEVTTEARIALDFT